MGFTQDDVDTDEKFDRKMNLYPSQNFNYLLFNSLYLSLLKSFSVQYATKQKSRDKTEILKIRRRGSQSPEHGSCG